MQSQATEQRPAQAATARAGRWPTPASMNSRCQSSSISNAQIRLSSSSLPAACRSSRPAITSWRK